MLQKYRIFAARNTMNLTDIQEMQPVSGVLPEPVNFEGLLDRDNMARVVDVMIDKFAASPDVELLYTKGNTHRGRPATPLSALLKIWVYGWLNGICSSRALAIEVKRNVELMYMLRGVNPAQHSISDFRRDEHLVIHAFFDYVHSFTEEAWLIIAAEDSTLGERARKVEYSAVCNVLNSLKALDESALLGADDQSGTSKMANLWDTEIDRLKEKVEKLKRQKARLNERLKKLSQK